MTKVLKENETETKEQTIASSFLEGLGEGAVMAVKFVPAIIMRTTITCAVLNLLTSK